jgi:hypothetical protein
LPLLPILGYLSAVQPPLSGIGGWNINNLGPACPGLFSSEKLRCVCSIRLCSDRALKFASQRLPYEPGWRAVAELAYHATRKNAADYVVPRLQNPDEHQADSHCVIQRIRLPLPHVRCRNQTSGPASFDGTISAST